MAWYIVPQCPSFGSEYDISALMFGTFSLNQSNVWDRNQLSILEPYPSNTNNRVSSNTSSLYNKGVIDCPALLPIGSP